MSYKDAQSIIDALNNLLTKEAESKEAGPSFVEDPVPKVPDSRTKESDKSVTFVHEEVELSDVPRDLVCLNSRNSTVVVLGNVETLRLADCSDCTFVAPCVRRSVVLERCDRMKLYIVCQQLRVHKSNNCLIRGYVAVAPLFEMVTHIQLGSWKTGPSLNLGRSVEVKGLAESTEGLTIDPYKPSAINSDDPGDMLEFEILDDPDPQSATVTILSD
ncbi:tubulin-binding cofactor C [Gregarina niphandrodes]|uniref:Tubulin-binding cofactor C n=1 Tax=Gregarina niphandrodes TaxID=110365 RepID=A0A023AZH4_GRENI|nr:tubulin-binding cofactor C [Gregarina niphandrodes]EZG43877.1 tubulin-binding cofactor C [Gregarina niphandrodes]|eukprot:XP_011132940.1 tubulin-binding cofactor C [Gregarina niphandrodes]